MSDSSAVAEHFDAFVRSLSSTDGHVPVSDPAVSDSSLDFTGLSSLAGQVSVSGAPSTNPTDSNPASESAGILSSGDVSQESVRAVEGTFEVPAPVDFEAVLTDSAVESAVEAGFSSLTPVVEFDSESEWVDSESPAVAVADVEDNAVSAGGFVERFGATAKRYPLMVVTDTEFLSSPLVVESLTNVLSAREFVPGDISLSVSITEDNSDGTVSPGEYGLGIVSRSQVRYLINLLGLDNLEVYTHKGANPLRGELVYTFVG